MSHNYRWGWRDREKINFCENDINKKYIKAINEQHDILYMVVIFTNRSWRLLINKDASTVVSTQNDTHFLEIISLFR